MLQAILSRLCLDHAGPGAHVLGRERRFAADLPARDQCAHVIDAAGGDDAALGDDRDAVRERLGFLEVVSGQHDRAAVGEQAAHAGPKRFARLDVESDGGFVEEQHLRAAADRHRELRLALLAAGKFAVAAIGELRRCRRARSVSSTVIGSS